MTERVVVSDIMAVRETAPHLVTGFAERSRAALLALMPQREGGA